jgi:hypothetical protein
LPAGEKAYLVDVTVTNVDLSSKASGKSGSNKSNRDGVILMAADMYLQVDDPSMVTSVAAMDSGNSNAGYSADLNDDTIECKFLASTSKQGAPEVADGVTTAVPADTVLAVEFIVTAKGSFSATVKQEPKLKISNFTAGKAEGVENTLNFGASAANHATWTVNGEDGSTITFGEKEPEKDIVVVPLEKKLTHGYAWDVTINKFDTAATYRATFTSGSESKFQDLTIAGEAQDAKVSFAAIMKTTKTNVLLDVAKK